MKVCRSGVTRFVVLVGPYAFKFPRVNYGWKMFLQGLLANMQENQWGRNVSPKLCPVVWSIPGGFLTVQKRAFPISDSQWTMLTTEGGFLHFSDDHNMILPVEMKRDSFGILDGQIVAVDYG